MNNDRPIKSSEEDYLQRGRFVDAAFNTIASIQDKSCYIIGLYGKWGTGKTSIIELLKSKFRSEDYYAVYFNPWNFETREALMVELFKKIYIGVKQEGKLNSSLKRVGVFLKKTADYVHIPKFSIGAAEIDASDTAKGLFRGLGNFLDEETGLEEQKEEVNQVLRQMDKPLIIFIDDVDRLDKDEIKLLFKIVKQTADFDNIRYILSLDEEMVSKSLAASYGGGTEVDGKKFIEKIVQLPLRIPELSSERRHEYTLSLFKEWQNKNPLIINENEWLGFNSRLQIMHRYFISTPRDSKRLMNAFEFVEASLNGEVNVLDLLLIESIRLFAPAYFQFIISNPDMLFEGSWQLKGDDTQEKYDVIEKETGLSEEQLHVLIGFTSWLFPYQSLPRWKRPIAIDEVYVESPNGGNYELRKTNLVKNQNIGSKVYFTKYLEFNIGNNEIPDSLFKEVLKSLNSEEYIIFEDSFRKIAHYAPDIIYNKFMLYDQELNEQGKSNLIQLFYVKPNFTAYFNFSNRLNGIFNKGERIQSYALSQLSSFTDRSLVAKTIENIVERSTSWHVVAVLLEACLYGFEQRIDQSQSKIIKVEPEDEVRDMADRFVNKILNQPIEAIYVNPAENKSFCMFPLFNKQNKLPQLKEQNIKFIREGSNNGVKYLKSFAPLMGINEEVFIDNNIHSNRFNEAEDYASREALLQSLKSDLRSLPANETVDYRTLSDDESVVVQYFKYVNINTNSTDT